MMKILKLNIRHREIYNKSWNKILLIQIVLIFSRILHLNLEDRI